MRIAYFYLMRNEPNRVRAVAAADATYWHDLRVPGYVGGPLGDRSGGLITFQTDSVDDARELVANDPFVRGDLLESAWVKEWNPDAAETVGRDLRSTAPGSPSR